MYDFSDFYQLLAQDAKLQSWLIDLPKALHHWQQQPNGDLPKWLRVLNKIAQPAQADVQLINEVAIGNAASLPAGEQAKLENLLRTFHPWRKGPYQVNGIHIDTEWRSDWKWDRVLPHISPLKNRYVLDVGCGNGYHMWRMLGQGAALTVGIDPCELFLVQFAAIRKLMGGHNKAHLLPLGIEALPKSNAFDTVFSMGVLYHRRSPLEHLLQLKDQLAPNGELVLETLVVEGDEQTVLVPVDRYAQMRNVYFFPSAKALKVWLEKCGFVDVRIVDESVTTTDEQRSTDWMKHQSLPDYLDKSDLSRTIEGYSAPKRAILVAKNSD